MGSLFGSSRAARAQAEATLKAAEMQAQSDRYVAQADIESMQTQQAQNKAAQTAADILSQKAEDVTINLDSGEQRNTVGTDGKRQTAKSTFFASGAGGQSI